MKQNALNNIKGDYVLATGKAAAHRLQLLHSLYGPGARRVLQQAGIQPVAARVENKRLLELSLAEAGPAIVNAGLLTSEELDRALVEMWRVVEDETALAMMLRMNQV